jgi:hypothetical protein
VTGVFTGENAVNHLSGSGGGTGRSRGRMAQQQPW